jgi:hypothetical protein
MNKEYKFLIAPIIFLILSWLKYLDTFTIQVDDNFFSSTPKIIGNYVLSFGALVYSFYLFGQHYLANDTFLSFYKLNIFLAIICFFTLPMYSSDIFSILSFGTDDNFNSLIYSAYKLDPTNIYFEYVYKLYRMVPCVYGPLNIWLSKLCQISTHSPLINLFSIKFVFFIFHLGFIYIYNYISIHFDSKVFELNSIRWVLLFPLVWFQGFMQLHNDILALFFALVGSLILFKHNRLVLSFLFFTLAFSIKFNFIIIFGIYLVYWFDQGNKIKIANLLLGILLSSLFLIFIYMPFIKDYKYVLAPVAVISKMGTHGSIKDILKLLESTLSLNWIIKFYDIILVIFILGLFYFRYRMKVKTSWLQVVLILSVIVISLYAHRFFPWYLLLIVFFLHFKFPQSRDWWKWFILISAAYCLQDLSVQIPHKDFLFHINVGLTTFFGLIAVFLFFRIRYLR